MTDPTSRQRGRPTKYRTTIFRYILSKGTKHLVTSPSVGSTPRHTDWQTVNRKITLTLTLTLTLPRTSASSSTTRTTNKWEPACIEKLRVSASLLVPPTARAFTSRHGHQDGPAQPSRRTSTVLPSSNGLHSVQYEDGLHLARTSYDQRPFQGLPRTFRVCGVRDHTEVSEIFVCGKLHYSDLIIIANFA
jgi:hypothetical protein